MTSLADAPPLRTRTKVGEAATPTTTPMSMPMTTPKTPHAPTTPHESIVDEGLHADASASTDERARSLAERLERARAHNKKRSPPHTSSPPHTPSPPHSPTTPHKDAARKPAVSQKTKQPWDVDVVLEGLLAPSYVVIDTPPPPSAASTAWADSLRKVESADRQPVTPQGQDPMRARSLDTPVAFRPGTAPQGRTRAAVAGAQSPPPSPPGDGLPRAVAGAQSHGTGEATPACKCAPRHRRRSPHRTGEATEAAVVSTPTGGAVVSTPTTGAVVGTLTSGAVVSTHRNPTRRELMGSTAVGSTERMGSTEAALDDAAQTIAATRANLVAVSRKQVVTEALSEALQTIESAKANLMYGGEGGTKALQQNLEQAIAELKAEIAGIDDRLCPCSSTAAPTGTVARRALEGGGQALATPSGGLG